MSVHWARNNKIACRNFSKACDFHDLVKTLIVRANRREYPNSDKIPIYTEYDPKMPNDDYPDIWMEVKGNVYVWELQEALTPNWKERMIKRYDDYSTLIIVDLGLLRKEWQTRLKAVDGDCDPLDVLMEIIENPPKGQDVMVV